MTLKWKRTIFVQAATSIEPLADLRRSDPDSVFKEISGEPCRIRTCDPLIKSQLLYQLS